MRHRLVPTSVPQGGDANRVGGGLSGLHQVHAAPGVPERIADLIPRVRLIYVLRNPLERIRSHYLDDVARGRERRPISDAVAGNEHYLAPSRYAMQTEEYLKHFPREQLLLVTSESLRNDRSATMRRVHDFIGVASDWAAPVQDREFNATAQKTAPGLLLLAARHIPGGPAAVAGAPAGQGCRADLRQHETSGGYPGGHDLARSGAGAHR